MEPRPRTIVFYLCAPHAAAGVAVKFQGPTDTKTAKHNGTRPYNLLKSDLLAPVARYRGCFVVLVVSSVVFSLQRTAPGLYGTELIDCFFSAISVRLLCSDVSKRAEPKEKRPPCIGKSFSNRPRRKNSQRQFPQLPPLVTFGY